MPAKRVGIQLCYPYDEKRLARWQPPYICQPKYDGERCRAVIDSYGNATLYSSEANEKLSVPHINYALKALDLRSVELDGEAYTHGFTWELIHGIFSRTADLHPRFEDLQYHIFDIISTDPMLGRALYLQDLSSRLSSPLLLSPTTLCSTADEVFSCFSHYCSLGYEGIIVRSADGLYRRSFEKEVRSTDVMKFKPKKEDYYRIAGYSVEVDKHGTPKPGRLGRFILFSASESDLPYLGLYPPQTDPPDGYFAVGSGLADFHRKDYWTRRESLLGHLLRVIYQHTTPGKGVPRFGVAKEILLT